MRKTTILTLAIIFVASVCNAESFVFAQVKNAKTIYSVPKIFELKNNSSNGDASVTPSARLIEKFYPIGWSKDGKFAFYSEPPDEACGCYFGSLIVQDMRTDKIVWSNEYKGDESRPDETIESHWRKNQKLFNQKLAQFGIMQSKTFTLLESPLEAAGDSVKIDFFSDVKLLEDAYNSKGNVVVKLISAQKGTKTIYKETYTGKGYKGVMNIEPGGVLISPFEPRAAVFLVETIRGWEGPPNITNLRVIGASLTTNFR